MTAEEIIKKYANKEIDLDGSYYWSDKKDVECYNYQYKDINNIFDEFSRKINDKTYYIIGNRFYFTYKNIKYRYSLSDFEDEENYIKDIIKALKKVGAEDVLYHYGRLD